MPAPFLLAAALLAAPVDPPVSFRREVQPVFTRYGCNQGACHGTPTGKGGFRLSLRGYDPTLDHHTLTREAAGRRLDRLDPDASLLLAKGTARAPHEGGRRIETDGFAYSRLRAWIAQGAVDDAATPPTLLTVTPAKAVLDVPVAEQTLTVTATFPDGTTADVSQLARFAVSDPLASAVSGESVRKLRAGEVAVTAEYMGRMATAMIVFRDPAPSYRWPNPPAHNFIDTQLYTKWQELRLTPANLSSDAEFVRRAHLDAVGRLPTPDRVRAFLIDPDPLKRTKLVDELLARDEFADWWGLKWADRLGVNQRFVGKIGAVKYHRWVRELIAANVSEDELARRVLTAAGPNYGEPAAGFFRRLKDPAARAEEIAQLFLGVRMQCAKCHNHPGERWTQNDYYGFAAFFSRLGFRDGPFFVGIYDKEETVVSLRAGEIAHPRTGRPAIPTFPGGPEAIVPTGTDRRAAFAAWLTDPANPFFARAAANRVWYHLFGRGLVEPVDDFRATNPAASKDLLSALASDFIRHGFDRKHLIRTIMTSRTYQLASRPADPVDDGRYFTHYPTRRLVAEQLLDAISDATGVPEKFPGFPLGTPAAALPDGEYKHPLLEAFGRPARAMACECERGTDTTLGQALVLQSSGSIEAKVRSDAGRVSRLSEPASSDAALIEELFLATLSRRPTQAEAAVIGRRLATGSNRRAVAEDVMHALLNHPDFLFQH